MRVMSGIAAILCVLLVAGCGGGNDDGPDQFARDKFGFTFDYPSDMQIHTDVSFNKSAGNQPTATVAVALDNDDLITVARYDLTTSISEQNLKKIKPTIDRIIAQLDPDAGSGERITVGKYPGYQYNISLDRVETGKSRYTVFFDDDVEYVINCQSTDENRQAIEQACDMALQSVQAKK